MNLLKEVKAHPVNQSAAVRLVLRSEKDGGGKDALEALHRATAIAAVLGKAEEVQHLGSALEANGAGLLSECKCGYPDGNKAVLPKGKPKSGCPTM